MSLIDQIQHLRNSLTDLYPELFLIIFFLATLVSELAISKNHTPETKFSRLLKLQWVGAFLLLALLAIQWTTAERGALFHNLLLLDSKAIFFKILVALTWIFALFHLQKLRYRFQPELLILLASAVLGSLFLCMAANLLTVYLSMEVISLSSYLLIGLSPKAQASEGSLKYLLFGTVSSAIMLYGISFLYGLTGSLDLSAEAWSALMENDPYIITVTILLTFGGLLFKLSLIPFHVWTPDTYEAGPTPIISFLSTAPKIAVLLALSRLLSALPEAAAPILGGIALISMTVGNTGALWQQNAKRLLAYSTIAQAGYLMVGLVSVNQTGFETGVFYLVAYAFLSMSAFLLADLFSPRSDLNFAHFNGKGSAWTIGGVALTFVMVALAGLPPTIGFTGKWLIFSSLWESYRAAGNTWMLVLLIGGILNAAISLAYYLKLPFLLFFKKDENGAEAQAGWATPVNSIVALFILCVVIGLFLQPQLLAGLIHRL